MANDAEREARRAAALRANLARRKAAARAVQAEGDQRPEAYDPNDKAAPAAV